MTTPVTIDGPRALSLLQRAVDTEGPDFVYDQPTKDVPLQEDEEKVIALRGCWYELNGRPSCGVGQALSYEGVPIEVLGAMDQVSGDTSIDAVDYILRDHGVILTQEALDVFSTFQSNQDLETPWGEALQAAKDVL